MPSGGLAGGLFGIYRYRSLLLWFAIHVCEKGFRLTVLFDYRRDGGKLLCSCCSDGPKQIKSQKRLLEITDVFSFSSVSNSNSISRAWAWVTSLAVLLNWFSELVEVFPTFS